MAASHSLAGSPCKTCRSALRSRACRGELELNHVEAQLAAHCIDLTDLAALTGSHPACEVPDVAGLRVGRHEIGHVNAAVVVPDHQLREQVVRFDTLGIAKPVEIRGGGHAGHLLR